jgi:DNA mismatch repair protein MutL
VQEVWNDLTGLGFSLELKTAQRLLAHAIPSLLSPGKAKEFLEDILATKPTSMDDLWATMACKSAIKAGDNLTADEALSLLEAWRKLPDRRYCPHGRPVEVSWSIPDLEKLFKRRP